MVMCEPPLPFGNAAARWFYVLLKGLVERGHRVKALATCSNSGEIQPAATLFPSPTYDLKCYALPQRRGIGAKLETLRRPYSYMFGADLKRDLTAALEQGFDVLHLEQLWTAWLGLRHADRALVNVHHLTWIDLAELRPTRLRTWLDYRLMWATERRLLRRLRYVRSCSPRLVQEMRKVNPGLDITTVPVGMEPALYPYIPDECRTAEPVVSVIGSMNWYPTHSAAVRLLSRLWPRIKARVPAARVQVVGWSARAALKDFLAMPDLTVVENVPDIRPYFERTGVLLYAPGRGSGMKIKILEAMAFGVPIVTTSEGTEGIPAIDGVHVGLCEDDDGLVERTVALLTDASRQDRQRAAARRLWESHCCPASTVEAVEGIYARMLGRNGN